MLILWILFVLVCSIMVALIMFQQPKGEMGFGSGVSRGVINVFGGSGGQEFFEKVTWFLGLVFFVSCISISFLNSRDMNYSILDTYKEVVFKNK